jgi:hypothetical protein
MASTVTGTEYIAEVNYLLGNRSDISDARMLRWINHAYHHLTNPRVHEFDELSKNYDFTLTASTNSYALDTTTTGQNAILGIRDVVYYNATSISDTTDKRNLSPRRSDWFDNHRLPSGGWPSIYTWDFVGPAIRISPVPTSTEAGNYIRVKHYAAPTALVAAGTAAWENPYWDEVLVQGALWIAQYRLGLPDLAVASRQVYVEMINEPADAHMLQSADENFRVDFNVEPYMPTS